MTRGRKYSQAEFDHAMRLVLAEVRELRAENASLKAKNTGLLRQLADADDVLLQWQGQLREAGRQDAMGAHPSLGAGSERHVRAATAAPAPDFVEGSPESSRPRLRLLSTPTETNNGGK